MKTNTKKTKSNRNGKGRAVSAPKAVVPVQPKKTVDKTRLQEADHEPIRSMNNNLSAMKNTMSDLSMQIWMLERQRNELATNLFQVGQALDTKVKEAIKAVGVDIAQNNVRLEMDDMTLHLTS